MRSLYVILIAAALGSGCENVAQTTPTTTPAATGIQVAASPAVLLRSGSQTRLTATITDAVGNPLRNTGVTFYSTTGTLADTAATTNGQGLVSTTLTGHEAATVTVTVPSIIARAIDVPAVAPFAITVTPEATPGTTGVALGMRVGVTMGTGLATTAVPAVVSVTCAVGSATTSLVAQLGSQVHGCTYADAGTYTVTARVIAENGWSASATSTATVTVPVTPTSPSIPPAPEARLRASVGCSTQRATISTPCTVFAVSYGSTAIGANQYAASWDFGDGEAVVAGDVVTHTWARVGTYVIVVTITADTVDGEKTTTVTTTINVPAT